MQDPPLLESKPADASKFATDLELLRQQTIGDTGIRIAVLDGPVDLSHSCFSGAKLSQLPSPVSSTVLDGAASQHGTHIASTIFGQPSSLVQGVAPDCHGLVLPVFADTGGDSLTPCSQVDLARGVSQATEAGAHVINVSAGQLHASGSAHPLLGNAIQSAADRGTLIVAAAGNEGCACLHVPAAVPAVLAVGAMGGSGKPLDSSNWGSTYQSQGILAPGEAIVGALPQGKIGKLSGTSFATALVSGVAGLLLSTQLTHGKNPDPLAVRTALLETAFPCEPTGAEDCDRFLAGSINIAGAYEHLTREELNAGSHSHAESLPSSLGLPLRPGNPAPDFTLQDHRGECIELQDYRGKKVLLWFYPNADTPD